MSILDIVIFILAGVIVGIYAYIQIKRTIKWRKLVKSYIKNGMTLIQAKEAANKVIFAKKLKKQKEKNNNNEDDAIFEE